MKTIPEKQRAHNMSVNWISMRLLLNTYTEFLNIMENSMLLARKMKVAAHDKQEYIISFSMLW